MKLIKLFLFVGLMLGAGHISAQSVYVTHTGTKFHKSSCHHLKYSKKEITLPKALELRFTACSVCKPSINGNPLGVMSTSTKSIPQKSSTKTTTSTQCTGRTKAGARCKRMAKSASGLCYQH